MAPPTPQSISLPAASAALFPGFSAYTVQTSTSPDVSIFALKAGSGPPLLLLHGYPQTHLIFHNVAPSLTSKYTVILLDLRGYGHSSKPSNHSNPDDHSLYSKSSLASDCVTVMDALGYANKPFYLCGHDRGGRVGHAMCVNYPTRVKKAMFLDILPTLTMFNATNKFLASAYWHWFFLLQPAPFPETSMLAAPQAFAEKQLLRMLKKGAPNRQREDVFVDAAWQEYCALFTDKDGVHAMCEDYRAGAQEDCEEQERNLKEGRKIKCPLRLLWGKEGVCEKGFDVKKEWETVCESGCVDKSSEAVEGGHYVPEEQPEVLTKHILEFFQDS